jgi:hypothetical protein
MEHCARASFSARDRLATLRWLYLPLQFIPALSVPELSSGSRGSALPCKDDPRPRHRSDEFKKSKPSQQFLQRHTGEVEPRLIKEIEVAIRPCCMEQRRGRVDNLAKEKALIVNRDWVVFPHGGHGKPPRDSRGSPLLDTY